LKSHFPLNHSQARGENQLNRNERNIREKPAQRSGFNLSLLKIHKQNNLSQKFCHLYSPAKSGFRKRKMTLSHKILLGQISLHVFAIILCFCLTVPLAIHQLRFE
jgi:hypothetical protein